MERLITRGTGTSTLPVLKIVFAGLMLLIKHSLPLLKLGLPIIMLMALRWWVFGNTPPTQETPALFLVYYALSIVKTALLLPAAVMVHRLVQASTTTTSLLDLIQWQRAQWLYLWKLIVMGLVGGLITLGLVFSFGLLAIRAAPENVEIFIFVLCLPMFLLISPWSLVLPAVSVGEANSSAVDAFNLAKDNVWRVTLVVTVIPAGIMLAFLIIPGWTFHGASLVVEILGLINSAYALCMLSLCYRFLADPRSTLN